MMSIPKKILIVDDDVDFVAVLESRLKLAGYQVTVVHTGREASEIVKMLYPDLILLELGLPDLPGDITALRIKSENGNRFIPMIALTSHDDLLSRLTTWEMGFVDHIAKPYEPEDLFNRIEKTFAETPPAILHKETTHEKTEKDPDR